MKPRKGAGVPEAAGKASKGKAESAIEDYVSVNPDGYNGIRFTLLYPKQKLRIERQKREAEAQKREFETLQRDTERNATRAYLKELEKERNRLAKELHDGVCNDLYALEMNASTLNESWKELLRTSRENIRRVSHELLPPTFQETTLKQVLQNYAERMTSASCKVTLTTLPEECDWSVLPETYCLNIYRIIQEATGNALKHAFPTEIHLTLEWKLPNLELTIHTTGNSALPQKRYRATNYERKSDGNERTHFS